MCCHKSFRPGGLSSRALPANGGQRLGQRVSTVIRLSHEQCAERLRGEETGWRCLGADLVVELLWPVIRSSSHRP
jgi:hypothetical protein